MKNNVYGYVRVSTKEQNEARQVIAMHEFGVDEQNIYMFCSSTPNSCIAITCRASFCSFVDTRTYPYTLFFILLPPVNSRCRSILQKAPEHII